MNRINKIPYKLLILTVIFLITATSSTMLFGQQKGSIKGTVTDAVTNEPMVGANVFIVELGLGSSTDLNGNFTIIGVPMGTHKILARFVGYKEQFANVVVKPGVSLQIDFVLKPTAVQLQELVVTGQGSAVERRKLTSTVESINIDEIKLAPVESLDQLLQGRVTGLTAFNSSGMPGTSGRIATRGVKSTITSSTPVVYVDNVRVDNAEAFRLALNTGGAESSALADLVVGDIEKIEVIKGGAASTLYGSEAANGVIQIFTKKGTPGPPRYYFNVTSGYDEPETKFILSDYAKDNVLRTGFYQGYEAAVSGGSQFFTYNVNGKILQNTGIITNDLAGIKTYNIGTGFRINLSERMNVEVSSAYTKNKVTRIYNNNTMGAAFADWEIGSYSDILGYTASERDSLLNLMLAPQINDDIDRFLVAVNYDYAPVKNWIHKLTFGIDYRKNIGREFVPKKAGTFLGSAIGWLNRADRKYQTITFGYTSSYTAPKLWEIDQVITLGAQGFRVEDNEELATGEDYLIPGTDDLDNASTTYVQEDNRQLFNYGFFITDQVGLFDKIFLDLGFRVDGNTTFGEAIGMQFYPKVGLAYNISQESFYPDFLKTVLPSVKLRTAWGQTGNFPTPFTRDRTYIAQAFFESSGLSFDNPGNDQIKPEKTTSIDFGTDIGLFNDRASLEINYFNQTTKDALFLVPKDPTTGFGTQLTNVGEISNKGIEIGLFAQLIQSENFSFNARISYATLDNKVVSLGGSAPFSIASFTFLPRRVEEGYPVGVFQVNTPIKDASGNYTGEFNTELVGNPLPKQYGSVGLNFTFFKNLTVSALTEFAFGHSFVNLKKTLRYFNGTEDTQNTIPEGYNYQTASSVWLEKADWIKIRDISLIYKIPESFVRGLSINASVRNLAVFGTSSTNDPELNGFQPSGPSTGGYTYTDISAPRQFRFGISYNL